MAATCDICETDLATMVKDDFGEWRCPVCYVEELREKIFRLENGLSDDWRWVPADSVNPLANIYGRFYKTRGGSIHKCAGLPLEHMPEFWLFEIS